MDNKHIKNSDSGKILADKFLQIPWYDWRKFLANELCVSSHSNGFQKTIKKCSRYVHDLMASPSSWEFYKEEQTKILWVHICTQDLTGVAISINKWWKTRYPEFKMRIVSKKEFENIKIQEQQQQQ